MNNRLKAQLITIAKKQIDNDISHDFGHSYRVMNLAVKIAMIEKADLDIVVPAALFHDIIVNKGTRQYTSEHKDSAKVAQKVLLKLQDYPKSKIKDVEYAIKVCSFSRGIRPTTIEAIVLQDADMLESTGAISIMRTFGSAVPMHITAFYDWNDPFCKKRHPEDRQYSLDLFLTRLLKVEGRMHTKMARRLSIRRTKFLRKFLTEVQREIEESR